MANQAPEQLPMPKLLPVRWFILVDGTLVRRVRDNRRAPRFRRGEYVHYCKRGRITARTDANIIESLPEVQAQLRFDGEEPGFPLRELTTADHERKAKLYREMQVAMDEAYQTIWKKHFAALERMWPDHKHLLPEFVETFDRAWKRPPLPWSDRDDMDLDGRYLPLATY